MIDHKESMTEILQWLRQLPAVTPLSQLSSDSRAIAAGDVFFAFPIAGSSGDGRRHIQDAIANGAAAVVFESDDFEAEKFVWDAAWPVPHKSIPQLQAKAGEIAHVWYAQPDRDMLTVAVTGTNGKTSCSQWLAKALSLTGKPSAVIGTLGVGNYKDGVLHNLVETGFTTPDAIQLQRRLADLRDTGAKALAIEASSIGLHQGRLNGLHVDVALLTNLTRDHLDYHGDMAAYAAAKTMLFDWPDLGVAVLNLDNAYGVQLVQHLKTTQQKTKVLAYSLEHKEHHDAAVIFASNVRTQHSGTSFHVDSPYGSGLVKTQMIGRFNVSNILGVLSVLLATGVVWSKAVSVIEKLTSVPGRMQQLGTPGHVMVIIDYAHTPDALEKTIQTLQQVASERHGGLWCVFGCGGDRDPGKRPQMGKIAQQAQHVVVTSDNPRTENPSQIIAHILQGMSDKPQVIEDRAAAILFAIKHAGNNDVVLLAGKGHESYQDINGKKWPFSDEEHASLALATVATSGNMKRGN
ncbi:UDP-N-acetylmuramoyl-L-alanyl-D-glutamate--2,6-diaminopimelate ligase [Undibacterium sp. RTI2.1]|uniref:UDP-N-acetylmuramoyl-L-alanyl-D-glutamate--2, 6-diaminopimelate ligase n=1 Tax=unclassified Undibacterium TaxID=2630295 RepID=UPI002AB40235|nr:MULTISPECIES: UDP-N-acetylmuramoyl-L-alanyl-D-glutamate--2,6-diaminopimelate ligase [unclassified Undibacterium]MDY7540350.1 UDP-N-acetylmuramoyl-L-alanyl-D-glutamate--2,6-diaminopimelate ligase [Undibacterium sp. 5I1]MEB0029958.1 UDP-N-acetylmuramoyl-L-alanyl-D-glutamate--2,6-diaminopimelate ligase [Undibacterium sp. RTI2.1]MEB0117078.1 UDP-N-acetylmuramoyl-L-alanyl-D-glutamate--2,6-diaminopimelate ligase [Undibacterium sp. RTI2.2]MEB0229982.1 UDP-N-acetylmuramoyl-L-alanyl-D-glutamate--2,6-